MRRIAIIGAGISGLGAALELRRAGFHVEIFEKSRGVSGRAATRRRGEICYDHGANFFRTSDPEFHRLVHDLLPTDQLVEIPGEVWTFDGRSTMAPGDPEQNAEPKYSYEGGISTLGKLLLAASGAVVRLQTTVSRLERAGRQWMVIDSSDEALGAYDDVLISIPAPQASQILGRSSLETCLWDPLREALSGVSYLPQFSFVLGFHQEHLLDKRFHALVNSDGAHPVSWLSFENDKAGHVPSGQGVVVVQMAPAWSQPRLERPREELLREVIQAVRQLLPEMMGSPDWWDSQRWLLAQPGARADVALLRQAESAQIYMCGDVLAGKARIPLAYATGVEAARRIIMHETGPVERQSAGSPV